MRTIRKLAWWKGKTFCHFPICKSKILKAAKTSWTDSITDSIIINRLATQIIYYRVAGSSNIGMIRVMARGLPTICKSTDFVRRICLINKNLKRIQVLT